MSRAKADYRAHAARVRELQQRGDLAGLAQALGDPTRLDVSSVRLDAVRALRRLRRPEAVAILIALLRDPDPRLRGAAAAGVARWGGEAAVRALAPVLRDADPAVRGNAISCLGIHGDASVVPLLVSHLDAKSWYLDRGSAVAALLAIGDPRGFEAAERQLRRERRTRQLSARRWARRMRKLRHEATAAPPVEPPAGSRAPRAGPRLAWALEISHAAFVLPDAHEHDSEILAADLRARSGSGCLVPLRSGFRVLAESRAAISELRALASARIRDHDLALVMTTWRWRASSREWEEVDFPEGEIPLEDG